MTAREHRSERQRARSGTSEEPSHERGAHVQDITGGMTDAVARMRRSDTERAARLSEALLELEE